MKTDFFEVIRACKIFSSLDDASVTELSQLFTEISLNKHAILFRQGDLSDGLYLVASGRLLIFINYKTKTQKILGEIHVGETLGEVGAISREPRAITAQALDQVTVLKLARDDYFEICKKFPDVMFASMDVMIHRARNLEKIFATSGSVKKHIVFIPASKKTSMQLFTEKLRTQLHNIPGIALIVNDDAELQLKYKTATALERYIHSLGDTHEKILYVLDLKKTKLAKICLEHADMLYVVAEANRKAYFNPYTLRQVNNKELRYKAKPELILLHEKDKPMPHKTKAWLQLAKFALQHHIRINIDTDWQRLLRFIRSVAVGLVLGGGGVRSWTHIGAMKALEEEGIAIDAIGGTSGGAIVAGYYALHGTYHDPKSELHHLGVITGQTTKLRNLTYPAISISSSKLYTQSIKKMFGRARIEDLWLPFFCVTCNLSRNQQAIQRSGFLWQKIRGTTAIPGVYPPLVINGQLHLDGGIVNNLPVDLMRQLSSNINTVIAIELIHNALDKTKYKFPLVLTFWRTLLAKLRIIHKDYRFPHFLETFLRALLMGSVVQQDLSAQTADVLVSPDLSEYNLLSVTPQQEAEMIEMGYQAAKKALKAWQRKSKK